MMFDYKAKAKKIQYSNNIYFKLDGERENGSLKNVAIKVSAI